MKNEKRYVVGSSGSYNEEFDTYKEAFEFYMEIRKTSLWAYIFDNEKREYLIKENC